MRTLMVTPFAPYRDGIATYAVQELRRLRQEGRVGDTVEVLSPLPSAARWHLRMGGPRSMIQLAVKASAFDRTIIQFGPEMLFGGCRSSAHRVAVWAGLAALGKRTSLDLRIHEIEYGPLEQNPLERRAARLALEVADRVTVHTGAERSRLDELIGPGRPIELVDHGRDFVASVEYTRSDARAELRLPLDQFVFLAIGFLQHHKGFDRAVDAIEVVRAPGVHLHIVGSARVDQPEITGYVEELARRCSRLPNATLHERFVSDVEFDLWLQAADVVVLPYREIWSSGVVERAALFDTPILASDLPQLRDQAPAGTVFFGDVDELSVAMEKLTQGVAGRFAEAGSPAAGSLDDPPSGPLTPITDPAWDVDRRQPDRASLQAQIVARARDSQIAEVEVLGHSGVDRRPVDPLLALGHLHRPQPNSARPGVAPIKRIIDRLIGWQIDPLATRLEDLQRAAVEAVAELDRRVEALPRDRPGTGASPTGDHESNRRPQS